MKKEDKKERREEQSGKRREAAFQTNTIGRIAQLGEHQTEDLKVSGSIPDPAT